MIVSECVRYIKLSSTHVLLVGARLRFTERNYLIPEDMGPVEVCVALTDELSVPITVRVTAQDLSPPDARGQFIPSFM